ncbi:hypothetical protein BGZ49_008734 [Haplosporangium sp. Z 27]|nr:hypothetical protein BGZ49_008734 [Haplosporangium sp. Z 27]
MKFIPALAVIFIVLFSGATASQLGICAGKEKLFELSDVAFDNVVIGAKNEICVNIKGNVKTALPQYSTLIEFTVKRPRINEERTWSVDLYSALKATPETSPLPITKGDNRFLRPCFFLPSKINDALPGEELPITISITTKDSDGDFVRVSCVNGVARIA